MVYDTRCVLREGTYDEQEAGPREVKFYYSVLLEAKAEAEVVFVAALLLAEDCSALCISPAQVDWKALNLPLQAYNLYRACRLLTVITTGQLPRQPNYFVAAAAHTTVYRPLSTSDSEQK